MAELVYAHDLKSCLARDVGSIPPPGTRIELDGFLEAEMRDARSASQGFPPNSPNEFRIFGALARTVFSPRRRFEPKISLAQTFLLKRSESEAIPSNPCATFNQFWKGSSQSFCLCERDVISSSSDFLVTGTPNLRHIFR